MSSLPPHQIHKIALLTGAGFTHNFGGYLGIQMWEHTFNNPAVQSSVELRSMMLNRIFEYNFERIYSHLHASPNVDFQNYQVAVEKAYRDMDRLVHDAHNESKHELSMDAVYKWLRLFAGSGDKKGFIFTLNQDLFFERHGPVGFFPALPGVPSLAEPGRVKEARPGEYSKIQLSALAPTAPLHDLNVIKLHGSCNWTSSDGTDAMVIGENKSELIEKEPLLKQYFEIFKSVLHSGGVQLWCVGYGFGDRHINSILYQGIKEHGLRLCIMSPVRPEGFIDSWELIRQFATESEINTLRLSIQGYIANSLVGVFRKRTFPTIPYEEMIGLMSLENSKQ